MERWKALPRRRFTSYDERGRYKLAPLKRIHVTDTTTMMVSCSPRTGRSLPFPNGRFCPIGLDRSKLPASLLIEVLREEGSQRTE